MKREMLAALLVVVVVLAGAGMASANPDPTAGFNAESVTKQLVSVGRLLLGAILLIFGIVGGYVIIQSLVDARKNGGWGHVIVGIAMVLIAGLALWSLVGFAGQNPQETVQSLQVKGK